LILMGVIWIGLGAYSLVRTLQGSRSLSGLSWIFLVLMFVNAIFFLGIGWGLGKQARFFFYLALLFLAGNILLTVTDEFGVLDFITLVVDACIVFLLIASKGKFHPPT
jgi:hypothetical protein